MGIHNELRRAGDVQRAIKNILGVDDGEAGVERFGETLQPILDLWSRKEWDWPRGAHRFARVINSPAVVARFSGFQLINAPTSKTAIEIEDIVVNSSLAGTNIDAVVDSASTVTLANPVTVVSAPMDSRGFSNVAILQPQLQLIAGDAAAGASNPQYRFTTPFIRVENAGFILMPRSSLFLLATVVNQAIQVNVRWLERNIVTNELGA